MSFQEVKNAVNIDALFVTNVLTNPSIFENAQAYARAIEILSSYAYAYSDEKVRKEFDAMNRVRIDTKKVYLLAVRSEIQDDVARLAAIENYDAVFNKYYLRLLFLSLHQRKIFTVSHERIAKTFYDFKSMRAQLANDAYAIVSFYISSSSAKKKIRELLENYAREVIEQ